jgi:hypothetical protein
VAPCPANLTLKNIAFTGTGVTIANTYAAKNNDIDNLTIDNCTFSDGAVFKMNGTCVIDRLTIKNSIFGVTGDADKTSILVQGTVSNVLIQDNTITGSVYNGIQITRVAGDLTVDGNTISNTGSRAIRIKTLEGAVLTITDNTMSNANTNEIYNEIVKIDGEVTEGTFTGNTYGGEEITFTDGIAKTADQVAAELLARVNASQLRITEENGAVDTIEAMLTGYFGLDAIDDPLTEIVSIFWFDNYHYQNKFTFASLDAVQTALNDAVAEHGKIIATFQGTEGYATNAEAVESFLSSALRLAKTSAGYNSETWLAQEISELAGFSTSVTAGETGATIDEPLRTTVNGIADDPSIYTLEQFFAALQAPLGED